MFTLDSAASGKRFRLRLTVVERIKESGWRLDADLKFINLLRFVFLPTPTDAAQDTGAPLATVLPDAAGTGANAAAEERVMART